MQWAELADRVGPILGFLVCLAVVAELADKIGVFDARDVIAEDGSNHGTGDYPRAEERRSSQVPRTPPRAPPRPRASTATGST